MKKTLIFVLSVCLMLSASACALRHDVQTEPTAAFPAAVSSVFSEAHEEHEAKDTIPESLRIPGPILPEEVTEGASEVYCSWPDDACGYALKKGYPAAGQMPKSLYWTEDGQSWELVRELSPVIHNYPKGLFFWNRTQGVILTDYHGYDECVYLTLDSGKTWNAVLVDLGKELSGYRYLEGERAWIEDGKVMLELSARFEDREPVMVTTVLELPS